MQRTERRLIDAALAVNDAPTLCEALTRLSDAARDLVGADRVSLLEWDRDLLTATIIAESGGNQARGKRIVSSETIRALIAGETPFRVTEETVGGLPAEIVDAVLAIGTLVCVPVTIEGIPALTFQASFADDLSGDECDLAISKLRLLARLTRVAFRAESERERARDDARLRAVLEAVPDGLVVRSADSLIINQAARDVLMTVEDVPEKLGLAKLWEDVSREPQHRTLRTLRVDGAERVHESRTAPVVDEDGCVFATVTLFRDVTEEHEERFIAEQFLQRLFDELPTAVAVVSPETRAVESANRAFLDLVGRELDDVVGRTPPYPWWCDQHGDVPARDDASRWEWVYRRPDGSLMPVEITRSLVHATSGDVAAVVVIANDLSERRELEQQLIQSGKLASIGELAAGVAHEINNPLFAILGFVEFLLLDAEPGTKEHERLTLIQGTALEIKEIVRALLDFARERSDEQAVVSLRDVAGQTVELMRRTSAAKNVEIVELLGDDDVPVHASANKLKQIFVNLISNATHAMKCTGGTLTVEVGRDAVGAWAEVRDTGPGIPPEALERVFEPFYTTRRDSGGTGLGLSVSLGIAQAHGGSLAIDPNAREGAVFRLRLPLAEETA
jgi:PAS domain S-box-containing protein